jgi:monoamine oxidase
MNLLSPGPDAAQPPAHADVVVVGAGLSGLLAAHLLEQAGREVLLVESRDRIGGRILGVPSADAAHRFDLGPAWVWPDINRRLAHWLTALKLPLFEQQGPGATLVELPTQALRRYAADARQQAPSMRLVGGTAQLATALKSRLQRTRVLLDTRLQALSEDPAGGVLLHLDRQGQPTTCQARSVILTLPPRLLASALRWAPALPPALSRQWAAAPTWMAGQAKLLAVYATPFWREQGLSGTAFSQAGPIAEWHDASAVDGRAAALVGFVGLPGPARQRLGEQGLIDAGLGQLVRLFGAEAATPLQVQLQDWALERDTAAPADSQPQTRHPSPLSSALPAPWRDRVHLAGSEFSAEFPGYLEGAVCAAERAVQALLSQQGLRPAEPRA